MHKRLEKFSTKSTDKSTDDIYRLVNDKKINIEPPYQRDVVWDEKEMSYFINSIYTGIVPNNIIFNIDAETGELICLDGKQRISSIYNFKKNKIPLILTDDNDNIEYIYYDEKPHKCPTNTRTFTQLEKNLFDGFTIHVVTYTGLSYIDQIDIFNRIQYGKKLTVGEKIGSLLDDIEDCKYLKVFCEQLKELFTTFNKIDTNRQKHVEIITNILYLIDKDDIPNKTKRDKYLNHMGKDKKIKQKLQNIKNTIIKCFSKDILKNIKIPKTLLLDIMYASIWFIHHNINLIDNIIVDVICELHKKYFQLKNKYSNFRELCTELNTLYKSKLKNYNKKLNNKHIYNQSNDKQTNKHNKDPSDSELNSSTTDEEEQEQDI